MKAKQMVWMFLLAGMVAARLTAQTLQTLVSFNGSNGEKPVATLTLGSDGNFYGITSYGGNINLNNGYGYGTIFRVTTSGILTMLVSFNNTNGATPNAGLTLGSDGNFYGTTQQGGGNGYGTVFKVTTDGSLTTLVSFNGSNGAFPYAGLTLGNDGNFYGTTASANSGRGTVFMMTTNGVLTTLASFNGNNGGFNTYFPLAALSLGNDGDFYGLTEGGGITNSLYPSGMGTVFKVTTNGVLTTLVSFTGSNGGQPEAALTLGTDGNFYGTTVGGGDTNYDGGYGYGTVFKVTTNGVLTTLVSFTGSNGEIPNAALTLGTDGNFYGTASQGGRNGVGTIFKVTTSGTLTTLVSFNGNNGNGEFPQGTFQDTALTLGLDGNFYGTTPYGGNVNLNNGNGDGTVFRLLLPPIITAPTMIASGQFQFSFNTVTGVNYAVQYSTNLIQWFPFVTLGGVGSPLTVIDPNAAGSQQSFYRIILSPQ